VQVSVDVQDGSVYRSEQGCCAADQERRGALCGWCSRRRTAKNGEPLFSSHMLDLSEEPIEENIATCVEYLERMTKCNILLEMEVCA